MHFVLVPSQVRQVYEHNTQLFTPLSKYPALQGHADAANVRKDNTAHESHPAAFVHVAHV